jgi:hypothetical protein
LLGVAFAVVSAGLLCGCSGEKRTPVYPVRGTVTVQGVQADNAQITLHPIDPKIMEGLEIRPMAHAGPDGKFAITSYATGDGAPAGEYIVTIEWHDKAEGAFDAGTPDKLGGKYADRAISPLRAVVEKKSNELKPFEL